MSKVFFEVTANGESVRGIVGVVVVCMGQLRFNCDPLLGFLPLDSRGFPAHGVAKSKLGDALNPPN